MIDQIGNYKILEEIGSGGMAVVYRGVQESLGRTVAIKALRSSVCKEDDAVARFEREAGSLASFQHENIITVYDFFPEGGSLFIVMEYVEGIDLYDLREKCDRLPADIVGIISLQVARALDYAHFRGLIHRDVKPANIIVSKLGTVKLMDFGIAQVEESDLTRAGVGLGTPAYMSPEQIVGKRLDQRSDIFSLGIVMYQMVTGQKPFEEDDQRSTMEKIRGYTPPAPRTINPAVPRELEEIIVRCMEKDPQDRFGSTQELVITMEQFLAARVNLNYRARLMLFLKEQGMISEDEVKAVLHPAMIGGVVGKVPRLRIKRRLAYYLGGLAAAAVLAVLVLILVLVVEVRRVRAIKPPEPVRVTVREEIATGGLRVVAVPWARVEVDGKEQGTTPLDRPLTLPVGKHKVRLLNPYFKTEQRKVTIRKGKTVDLTVALKRAAQDDGEAPAKDEGEAPAKDEGEAPAKDEEPTKDGPRDDEPGAEEEADR